GRISAARQGQPVRLRREHADPRLRPEPRRDRPHPGRSAAGRRAEPGRLGPGPGRGRHRARGPPGEPRQGRPPPRPVSSPGPARPRDRRVRLPPRRREPARLPRRPADVSGDRARAHPERGRLLGGCLSVGGGGGRIAADVTVGRPGAAMTRSALLATLALALMAAGCGERSSDVPAAAAPRPEASPPPPSPAVTSVAPEYR